MHKICWNEAKTVGIIVNESVEDYQGLTYELRKGALNTLGVVSADFVEAWAEMTADDNCTIEDIDSPVPQLGGSPEDLRNTLCGVIECAGIKVLHDVIEYALRHRGINAFDGKKITPAPETHVELFTRPLVHLRLPIRWRQSCSCMERQNSSEKYSRSRRKRGRQVQKTNNFNK